MSDRSDKRRAEREKRKEKREKARAEKDPDQVRRELYGDEPSTTKASTKDVGGGQVQEEKDTRSNMEILQRTIQIASETSEIGTQVATQLDQQTEQMHRMDRTLAEINASLQRSERILKGMESWTASIRKNWTTFVPEKPKLFTKTKQDVESEGRERDIKDNLGKGGDDTRDTFVLPKNLEGDEKTIASLLKTLEKAGRYSLRPGEKLLYYYNNSNKFMTLDKTADCILVSNRRIIKLEKGKEFAAVDMIDIAAADLESQGPGRYEKVILSTRDGKSTTIGIWGKEVASFLRTALQKIADTNDIPIHLIKARQELEKEDDEEGEKPKRQPRVSEKKSARPSSSTTEKRQLHPMEEQFLAQKKEEDKQLDVLLGVLDGIHAKGVEIGKTLKYQDQLLDHLGDGITTTTTRMQDGTKKVNEIIRKG